MDDREFLAHNLAAALLASEWRHKQLTACCGAIFGPRRKAWHTKLVAGLQQRWAKNYPPRPDWLVAWLLSSRWFERLAHERLRMGNPVHSVLDGPAFNPAPRFAHLDVPILTSFGDVACWLGISLAHLEWWADLRRQSARTDIPILQNYIYAFVEKRSGPPRLIEQPKPKLKAAQRLILREILDHIPPHQHAHGFVKGRSCITSASPHAGEVVVVTMDLESFFANTLLRRVHGLFRSLGYPWQVARVLTGLCSTSTPPSVFHRLPPAERHDGLTQRIFTSPHLPQGAPTSPALANLAAWRLDVRLSGLARRFEANYTRYADDMAFSGGEAFARHLDAFVVAVAAIANDEGWAVNGTKTRIMRRSASQRMLGLVVNDRMNIPRAAFDELKAVLHNCIRTGPEPQNRAGVENFRAHLEGRVAWVESIHPARGARLRSMLDLIVW